MPKTLFPVTLNSYIKSPGKTKTDRDEESHAATPGLVTASTAEAHL